MPYPSLAPLAYQPAELQIWSCLHLPPSSFRLGLLLHTISPVLNFTFQPLCGSPEQPTAMFCKLSGTSHTPLFPGHHCSPATQLGLRADDLFNLGLQKSEDSWCTWHYRLFRSPSSVQHIVNILVVEKSRHFFLRGVIFMVLGMESRASCTGRRHSKLELHQ